ncbi:tadC protein [Bifidobacterium sp. UTBIF-68]|uniref:tadC protein n=1 Tax=Bifidobacterium sp. UTBIF-68 TaxID=1465262 RepID=UPI0015E436A6|nr:tadC protein [Bifidobacterium sp. UTBIF-68]
MRERLTAGSAHAAVVEEEPDDATHTMLILRLLRVALVQGASIPDACEAVGYAAGGSSGRAIGKAGELLKQGVAWSDAWHMAEHSDDGAAGAMADSAAGAITDASDGATAGGLGVATTRAMSRAATGATGRAATGATTKTTTKTTAGAADDAGSVAVIRAALEPSWLHGDAPAVRLESALEQLDADERSAIERRAARLSVKLLVPTGLCFLPAFIMVGVIPSMVSFIS